MYPAVRDGDLVLTFRLANRYPAGSVAAYRSPEGELRLGRIVAVPGDTIDIDASGSVMVNGLVLAEEVFYPTAKNGDRIGELPLTVPDGSYYLLNDYRSDTHDSRAYGAIEKDKLKGTAFWLFRRRGF